MKVRENDKPSAQHSRFLKMFKQLRLEIGLKDALVEMPKFNKWLSSLLRNKEKLEEIAITTVNAECSAIIMNKLYRTDRTSALADSGASNLPFTSFYILMKLGLKLCFHARMDTRACKIVQLLTDGHSRGRPFLRTAKALIDLYEETFTLRFRDELAPLDSLPPGNDNSTLKKDLHEENFQDHSNPLFEFDDKFKSSTINPLFDEMEEDAEIKNSNVFDEPDLLNTPLSDKVECSAPEDNNDEIDAFLSMEVSSNFEEGYFDSEGDVTFLDKKNLFSDDDSHIRFLKSDSLHHDDNPIDFNDHFFKPKDFKKDLTVTLDSTESSILPPPLLDSDSPFTAELSASVTLNSLGNEDKIFKPGILVYHAIHDKNLVTLEENLRENISSGTLLFLNEPSIPHPPPESPDVEKCFEPEAGILITKVFKGVSKSHDFMADILPTLPTLVSELTFIFFLFYFSPSGMKIPFLTPASSLRAGGLSSGWNFHVL
ncbi:hypothetical protein Tco_0438855 [Tanacetum coccineum]